MRSEGPFNDGFNYWDNYGSVHLTNFDYLWVFEIVSGLNSVQRTNSEEAERGGGRISEKREKEASIISLHSSQAHIFFIVPVKIKSDCAEFDNSHAIAEYSTPRPNNNC